MNTLAPRMVATSFLFSRTKSPIVLKKDVSGLAGAAAGFSSEVNFSLAAARFAAAPLTTLWYRKYMIVVSSIVGVVKNQSAYRVSAIVDRLKR